MHLRRQCSRSVRTSAAALHPVAPSAPVPAAHAPGNILLNVGIHRACSIASSFVSPNSHQPSSAKDQPTIDKTKVAMRTVFLCTSAAGTLLVYVLYRARLVPRPIATLGLIDYQAMLVGTVLERFKLLDLQQGAGLALVAPVGLFELVLPIWLIAKGLQHRLATTEQRGGRQRLQRISFGATCAFRNGRTTAGTGSADRSPVRLRCTTRQPRTPG